MGSPEMVSILSKLHHFYSLTPRLQFPARNSLPSSLFFFRPLFSLVGALLKENSGGGDDAGLVEADFSLKRRRPPPPVLLHVGLGCFL